MMYRIVLIVFCMSLQPATASVSISTSIKPLEFIAAAIAGEQARVSVLADDTQSAHQFSLLPSDRISLERAAIVLWIGPEFEVQLADFLERYKGRKSIITSMEIESVQLLQLTAAVADPHIWLSPNNAMIIAELLAAELSQIDPDNEPDYKSNLDRFTQALDQLRLEVEKDFSLLRSSNNIEEFVVYHNAFQYFESVAGIRHSLALVHDPEREPSIREMMTIRNRIAEIEPACLFLEPDANSALVDSLFSNSNTRRVSVDVLGRNIAVSEHAYVDMMEQISNTISECLQVKP